MATHDAPFNHKDLEYCNDIIKQYKDDTMYFNGEMSFDEVYNMFRLHYGFYEAETKVIIASLIKAGAKFR